MTNFLPENFLLHTQTARNLYKSYAKDLPIINYASIHNAKDIYENAHFENATDLWLRTDRNKWRLMRSNGISEYYITGKASDKEKFLAFAETIENAVGNVEYYWLHMELRKFFGIHETLTKENALVLYEKINAQLGPNGLRVRDIVKKLNVKLVGTQCVANEDLHYHRLLKEEELDFSVVPIFHVNKLLELDMNDLGQDLFFFTGKNIQDLYQYTTWIKRKMNYFHERSCRSLSLSLPYIYYQEATTDVEQTFAKIVAFESITAKEIRDLKNHILFEILDEACKLDWVLQLYFGINQNGNSLMTKQLGKNMGFDTISLYVQGVYYLFDTLRMRDCLPKTIVYNGDGTKNTFTNVTAAAFNEEHDGIRGKIQQGPAWWFQNNLLGTQNQLKEYASQGILMNFVGMTSGARNFISLIQHDYFRMVLCQLIADWLDNGLIIDDAAYLKQLFEKVCYKNAVEFFGFEL